MRLSLCVRSSRTCIVLQLRALGPASDARTERQKLIPKSGVGALGNASAEQSTLEHGTGVIKAAFAHLLFWLRFPDTVHLCASQRSQPMQPVPAWYHCTTPTWTTDGGMDGLKSLFG